MYRTKCSVRDGCSPPAPTVTVTSNHCPRLTESGAAIFGVCFGSKELCDALYSGVNCSSCPLHTGDVAPAETNRPRQNTNAATLHAIHCARLLPMFIPSPIQYL